MYVPVGATEAEKRQAIALACKMHPEAKGCEAFRPKKVSWVLLLAVGGAMYWYTTRKKKA